MGRCSSSLLAASATIFAGTMTVNGLRGVNTSREVMSATGRVATVDEVGGAEGAAGVPGLGTTTVGAPGVPVPIDAGPSTK